MNRILRPEPWMDRSVCAETDPELFFPPDGANTSLCAPVRVLCRSCEVRLPCLRFALDHHELGIWGGFTERARQAVLTQHRRGRPLEDIIAEDDEAWLASVEAGDTRASKLADQRRQRREKTERLRISASPAQPRKAEAA